MAQSGCLPSRSMSKDVQLLSKEDMHTATAVHIELDSPRQRRSRLFSSALIASLVLLSCLGISGFIMAAWSTHKLNNANKNTFALTSAILVTDPSQAPSGYSLVANMFRGTGYWAPRQAMPYFRSDHGAVTWNDTVYIVGGQSVNASNTSQKIVLNKLVSYNPVYNFYTNLSDMPGPLCRFGFAVVGNTMYIFGGYNDTSDLATPVDTMMMYNFLTDTWNISSARMTFPRSDTCQGVIGNKIYVTGGYDINGNTLAVIEVFDPATSTWSTVGHLNTGRGDCGAVASGDQLYVMGGTQLVQPPGVDCSVNWYDCYVFLASVERFSPANSSVQKLANMNNPRGDFAYVESTVNSKLLVAGGEYSDVALGVTRMLAQPWAEEYDIGNNYWTPKAPLPDARFRSATTTAGGQLLVFGGQPSCPAVNQLNDTSCYQNGFNTVLSFTDVPYPNVYLLTRLSNATDSSVL